MQQVNAKHDLCYADFKAETNPMTKLSDTSSAQKSMAHSQSNVSSSDVVAMASGVGLHSGFKSKVLVRRSSVSASSIDSPVFEVRQGDHLMSAPALVSRLSGTARATALVLRGSNHLRCELRTVEHYLAALFVLGLEPLVATIESAAATDVVPEAFEVPILDGSAKKWLEILDVFSVYQPPTRKAWKLIRSFEVRDDDKYVCLSPAKDHAPTLEISCSVDFGFGWQQSSQFQMKWNDVQSSHLDFKKRIAPARTFGFVHELEALRKRGLALGGTLDNAILLDGDKVVNPEGFVVENELAAHKLLDIVGDFALLGKPLIGRIDTHKSGHSMHVRAAQEAIKSGALVEVDLVCGAESVF